VTSHAEVEKAKPEEPEAEEDRSFDSLDDPVRMYMKQMGKVPLLSREQEIEVCKSIEKAELEMTRLVYGLGFTAKEHSTIAQKLLADPPKERFDRIVLDSKVTSRESHLQELRSLLKKMQALDAQVDEHYALWKQALAGGRREKLFASSKNWRAVSRPPFPKFFYKQKVVEDIVAVASNLQAKLQAGLKRIQEIESEPKSSRQQAALREERAQILALEQLARRSHQEFSKTFEQLQRAATKPMRPRATWRKRTCGWWCPSRRSTSIVASPFLTWFRKETSACSKEWRNSIIGAATSFPLMRCGGFGRRDPLNRRPGPHDPHPSSHD
jgi:RNA polymerase primary sigma factor